jgi:hypothetical protein
VLAFEAADTPEWVGDWLRRRRGAAAAARPAAAEAYAGRDSSPAKDVHAAQRAEPEAPQDPEAAARREEAAAKRSENTERAIREALDALEQWISDQLRLGLSAFIDDATARCRRIAARLVDGKAGALAGRIDELPARLLTLPVGDRPRAAVVELGKLVLLARAFRANSGDAGIRRAVASTEPREAVLGNPDAPRISARWEVLAEQIQTRRDGLVSQTTWLLNLDAIGPRFAMLLDYFPASAGRRGSTFTPGERFAGELVFLPARHPLRALLLRRSASEEADAAGWPAPEGCLTAALTEPLLAEPWALDLPVLLPAGRIAVDGAGPGWWRSCDGLMALPLTGPAHGLLRGTELTCAAAIWSGNRLTLLAAQTPWGRVAGGD